MPGIKLKPRGAKAGRVPAALQRGPKPSGPAPLVAPATEPLLCPCGKPGTKVQTTTGNYCSEACMEQAARPTPKVGATVPINALKPGQHFKCEIPKMGLDGGHVRTGYLVYCTAGRALVELDAPQQRRRFTTRKDEDVNFTAPGRERASWSPGTEVIILEGTRDFALQPSSKGVQNNWSSNSGNTPAEGNNMATKKSTKAAKKATSGTRVGTSGSIKVVNKEHGAREGTKRAKAMDILLTSKHTDDAMPKLEKIGADRTFITFAVKSGFITLTPDKKAE